MEPPANDGAKRETSDVQLKVDGQEYDVSVEPDMPLLWVLRDELGITGPKFGCGIAMCGACTVHIDGVATRSCITEVGDVAGKSITTIEGLDSAEGKALKQAWVEEQVPQCGYCQSGQIMAAAALLDANPNPSSDEIDAAMSGNICRCGCYPRIKRAIQSVSENALAYDAVAQAEGRA